MKNSFLSFPEHTEDAKVSIIGAPYDLNSSRRYGSREGPQAIREESLYLEDNFAGRPLYDLPVEDMGDAYASNWNEFRKSLKVMVKNAVTRGSIPVVLGGDHSITPVVIDAINRKDISIVSVDAHLDFDDSLNGNRFSHGSPRRREAEMLGGEHIYIVGIRSWKEESRKDAEEMGVHIYDSFFINKNGIENIELPKGSVYLTIDIDGIDQGYAPGTGTPEPFGLNPWDVLWIIESLSERIVGMDIVEVCPRFDINGITATLASRVLAAFISSFFEGQ